MHRQTKTQNNIFLYKGQIFNYGLFNQCIPQYLQPDESDLLILISLFLTTTTDPTAFTLYFAHLWSLLCKIPSCQNKNKRTNIKDSISLLMTMTSCRIIACEACLKSEETARLYIIILSADLHLPTRVRLLLTPASSKTKHVLSFL